MAFQINLIAGPNEEATLLRDPAVVDEVRGALVMAGFEGENALERFQAQAGLRVSGALDPETLDALGVVLR